MKSIWLRLWTGLASWPDRGLAVIYPRWCPTCGDWLWAGGSVCPACFDDLERTQALHRPEAGLLRLRMGYPVFDHACAALEFQQGGGVQRLIHSMKYEQRPDLARYLGRLLGREIKADDWWRGYESLVPVPLHPSRYRQRGYNQSERFAQGLHSELKLPVRQDLVRRIRNTRSQTGLSREQREANVTDAFEARPTAAGRRLLLVDDVVTTGATLLSLASSLRRVGVGRLGLLVLADAFAE